MPSFNRFGQWTSGVAGMGVYFGDVLNDGTVRGELVWRGAGGAQWLVNRILCGNYWETLPQRVMGYNTTTKESVNIITVGFNNLTTSQLGQWAGWSRDGVVDWKNRAFPLSYIDNNSMGPDGSYCIKRNYQSNGGWDLLFANEGERIPVTAGNMEQITNLGNGKIVWTTNDGMVSRSKNMPSYNPIAFPIYKPRMIQVGSEYWQLYANPTGCYFHPVNSTVGYKIGDAGNYFGLDAFVDGDHVFIIWSLSEGEILSDIRAKYLKFSDTRTELKNQPIPVPIEGDMRIRAFERPMWQSPYYSFHQRYGDTDIVDYLQYGNAITIIGDEADANVRDTELVRLSQLGRPMIVDIGTHQPDTIHDNLTVAWLAAGGTINQLVDNVAKAKEYYEKPIIAYLDGDNWPTENPFPTNVWPSIQAYRFPIESMEQFINRVQQVIDRVNGYEVPMVLTTRFDDFNGSQSPERILECMKYYEFWLSMYPFVGHMPFADRRGNGISKIPAMKDWAIAFNYASIRPNRFDYWQPSGQSTKDILVNKFGQSRANPVIEKSLREDILGRYL